MKTSVIGFLVIVSVHIGQAQSTHDVIIGGGNDIIKSDIVKPFNRSQIGADINYFVVRHFAVGGGVEFWSTNNYHRNSFVMGMRWYAMDKFFLRCRSLVGVNDVSAGLGWSQPLTSVWRVEGIGDYYFHGDFAFRIGIQYIIRR